MKKLSFLLMLFVAIILLPSCEKDDITEPGQEVAPQLPPAETFIMPFTGFEDADTTGFKGNVDPSQKSGPPSYGNWFHAVSHVVVWNTVLSVTMAIPVAAFEASFNHDPVHVGNGVFVWTYEHHDGVNTFITELSGQFINNNTAVRWEMKASKVGGFTDMLWYSGVVSTDFTSATWNLNHKPHDPEPFLNISYDYDPATEDFFIRYTNAIPGSPDQGDYIEYRASEKAGLNRAYDVYRADGNNLLEIQWNAPHHFGRVKNPAHFGDNNWHCWDEQLMNAGC